MKEEFREIAHSGGKLTIYVKNYNGKRGYQLQWMSQRPVPAAIFGVYALPQGVAVGRLDLGGIGQPFNPPPIRGCFQVFIGSDSHGMFGHECPSCNRYWRDAGGAAFCPYCRAEGDTHNFLTDRQKAFVFEFCAKMCEALESENEGEYVIDMDAVADAVDSPDKPPFYYAEVSQQNYFTCDACGRKNDILGVFGYCSVCGTRNDLQQLSQKTIPSIRERINSGGPYEACVRDAVAAFDSYVGQSVQELVRLVPLTTARKNRLKVRFHNLNSVATELKESFDIDILAGLKPEDVEFAKLMFHRRHVYEHNAGEADEKYILDSGDTSVRPKQALHESQESSHRIASLVLKMAGKLHAGFHELFPPDSGPINQHQRYKRP